MYHIYSMKCTPKVQGYNTPPDLPFHHMHSIYFIEHMWHTLIDAYTTHESVFMCLHYIYIMLYTQHMHHGGRVTHAWSSIIMQCKSMILAV